MGKIVGMLAGQKVGLVVVGPSLVRGFIDEEVGIRSLEIGLLVDDEVGIRGLEVGLLDCISLVAVGIADGAKRTGLRAGVSVAARGCWSRSCKPLMLDSSPSFRSIAIMTPIVTTAAASRRKQRKRDTQHGDIHLYGGVNRDVSFSASAATAAGKIASASSPSTRCASSTGVIVVSSCREPA